MEKIKNVIEHGSARVAALLLIGGVALIGCGDESSNIPASDDFGGVVVVKELFDNGTRTIRFSDDDENFADILQFCDGPDLVEQTDFVKIGYGAAGNSVHRSVGHSACADGLLDKADFKTVR